MKGGIFNMQKINKRGQSLGGLYGGILVIAAIGILLALVMYVLTTIGASLPAGSAAQNATGTMVTQFVDFMPWLGIILLVLAAGVVLFFVIRSFAGAGTNKGGI
jgi:type II secretory pathway component PulF